MRYKLVTLDSVNQEIWDEEEKRCISSFIPSDFTDKFLPSMPSLIVDMLNKKSISKEAYHQSLLAVMSLCKSKDKIINSMMETIEGLKVAGQAFNFILPKPVDDEKDCVTTSEIYKTQYNLSKKQWSGYYSRFYEKRPNEFDYLVQRMHRDDLHHLRNIDGKWYCKVTIKGKTHTEYVGKDEEQAKLKRDALFKQLGFNYE